MEVLKKTDEDKQDQKTFNTRERMYKKKAIA